MTMVREILFQEEKQVSLRDLKLDVNNVMFRHNNSLLNDKNGIDVL